MGMKRHCHFYLLRGMYCQTIWMKFTILLQCVLYCYSEHTCAGILLQVIVFIYNVILIVVAFSICFLLRTASCTIICWRRKATHSMLWHLQTWPWKQISSFNPSFPFLLSFRHKSSLLVSCSKDWKVLGHLFQIYLANHNKKKII